MERKSFKAKGKHPTQVMRERVKALAANNFLSRQDIARALKIEMHALLKHYKDELNPKRAAQVGPTDVNEVSRRKVAMLIASGLTQEETARQMGLAIDTLRRRYKDVIESALDVANSNVAKSLYRMATGQAKSKGGKHLPPNVIAAIFWLKAKAKWREVDETPPPDFDYSLLDATERRTLRLLLSKAQIAQGLPPKRDTDNQLPPAPARELDPKGDGE